jgi:4-amino-4-deoxy-L-arabinose transferase-like glycosyltransferase
VNPKALPSALLAAVVVPYVAIGAIYATLTPTWQVPDEPAHYNYVRQLAEGQDLPIIEPGDYDHEYLERLKSEHFPPELPVDAVEYEDHQPPLYYLLATPIYWLFGGAVLPLRLLSVLLGAGVLLVALGTVRTIFPQRPELAPMVAAFIAFIPQHVAMMAGVQNDPLAELVVGSTLWALMVYIAGGRDRPWQVGLLVAAALLTKTTAYLAVMGGAAAAALLRCRQERRPLRWGLKQLAWMLIPGLLLSAPWFIRNGLTYGWHDPLGWARHDEVVAGQLRSSQYLAQYGWGALLSGLVRTTFQSFWGQLGWMAVPLPGHIYLALALLSIFLVAGFLWWLLDLRRPALNQTQHAGLILLLLFYLLTLLEFLGYNLKFLQHQGRYLFPALIPIGTAAALGLSRLARVLPQRARPWAIAALFAGMAVLDVYCLFKSIPFLTG